MNEAAAPRVVLIVDGDAPRLQMLAATVSRHGYAVATAATTGDALTRLRAQPFDLLLVNRDLPAANGADLLTAALEIDPALPGLLMDGGPSFSGDALLPVVRQGVELRRLRDENIRLAQQLDERTRALEASDAELQSFTDSVSHDLRSPLRAVNGFAQILRMEAAGQLSPDSLTLIEHVISGAKRMERLIDDLLRFSRLGRHQLAKAPHDLRPLVEGVVAELTDPQRVPVVEVRIGSLPVCVCDGPLVRQVFVNLLSNAFKFTRDTPAPIIEVFALTGPPVVYAVRDNGAGFDLHYATRLFGVFQRFHRQEAYEGTGVGLSIAHRIVIRHGGRIWAESAVGQGTTFYFTLEHQP